MKTKNIKLESNKYYLYCFSLVNQLTKKDFKFNIKLETGKIIFELSIDGDTQNTIFGEFMKLMRGVNNEQRVSHSKRCSSKIRY